MAQEMKEFSTGKKNTILKKKKELKKIWTR